MNELKPYTKTDDYAFSTQLPETPGGLTSYQKQLREHEFLNHVAFQRRRIVTIVVVAFAVATLVAHIATHGINRRAAFATLVGVGVAYIIRNIHTPRHTGTKQIYQKP